jgi:hypothetical protein
LFTVHLCADSVPQALVRAGEGGVHVRDVHARARGPTERSPDAFLSVPYRDHWFWIDDRDLATKRTFALLMLLFSLADTGEKKGLPLITIQAQ